MLGFKRKPNKREIAVSTIAIACIMIALFIGLSLLEGDIKKERNSRIPKRVVSLQTTQEVVPDTKTDVIPTGPVAPPLEIVSTPIDQSEDKETKPITDQKEPIKKEEKNLAQEKVNDLNEIKAVQQSDFLERTPSGMLPKKDAYNRAPWKYYSKNFTSSDKDGRIVIIINNVGFDEYKLKNLLAVIPSNVTLALNPYSDIIEDVSYLVQKAGHEYLMMLPMEASDYPLNDPGSKALLTTISRDKNLENLHWIMGRSTGYVGLINHMGKAFSRPNTILDMIFEEFSRRGVLYINSLGLEFNIGEDSAFKYSAPYLSIDLTIDEIKTKKAIEQQLNSLELLSKEFGYAVGIMNDYPFAVKQFSEWAKTLPDKNIEIVPITNLFLQPATQ